MDVPVQPPGVFSLPPKLVLREEQQRSRHEARPESKSAKKGEPWTEDEHLAFLQGLQRLGKGQWKSIAKYYVPSRTATQVASHAQKHFLRVSGSTKRRSRFSAVEEATLANAPAPGPPGGGPAARLAVPSLQFAGGGGMETVAVGQPVSGIAVGVPLGTLPPWLPPPVNQHAASLPILPVGPADGPQGTHRQPSPLSSRDSRGTSTPPRPQSSGSSPPHQEQQGPAVRPRSLPLPTSRQQQLFRLLEMREQMQAVAGSSGLQPGGSSGGHTAATAPCAPPGCLPFQPQPLLQHAGAQPRPAASAVSAAAGPRFVETPLPPGSSRPQPQHTPQPPCAAAPKQLWPVQSSPVTLPPTEQQQQQQAAPRLVPPPWGSMPEGLAMLAAAAACSDKGGSGGGGKEGDGCSPQDTDSDTDTTGCERHTV